MLIWSPLLVHISDQLLRNSCPKHYGETTIPISTNTKQSAGTNVSGTQSFTSFINKDKHFVQSLSKFTISPFCPQLYYCLLCSCQVDSISKVSFPTMHQSSYQHKSRGFYPGLTHAFGSDIMSDSQIFQNNPQPKICFCFQHSLYKLDTVKHGILQVAGTFYCLVLPTD